MNRGLFFFACFFFIGFVSVCNGDVEVSNAFRTIDLTSQISKNTIEVEYTNKGGAAISEIKFNVPEENLAFFEVTDNSDNRLSVHEGTIELAEPLQSKDSVELTIRYFLTHVMEPFPAKITQGENQLVRYSDNHFISFPYFCASQKTTVELASSVVKSFSEEAPTSQKGDSLEYGPYADVAANSESEMKIHFQNNSPFFTITELVREIEISHWGNVAVEETYFVEHSGPVLKGAFSRFDYQRSPAPSAIAQIKTVLPAGAINAYYRDEIGNISTSNFNVNDDESVSFDLKPRFVLFGGWKTNFYLGYNIPAYNVLSTNYDDSTQFILNTEFAKNVEDVVIDKITVRVILPEGSSNIEIETPFPVSEPEFSKHFTFLDTSGRPVISVTKENIVHEHNENFQITYTFKRFSMIREPLLCVGAFFALFLSIMFFVRLDLSIKKVEGKSIEVQQKIIDLQVAYRNIGERRNQLHDDMSRAISTYKKSKVKEEWNNNKSKFEDGFRRIDDEATRVQSELASLDSVLGHKVRDVERKEKARLATHKLLIDLETQNATNKVSKSAYAEQKTQLQSNFENLDYDIEDSLAQLTEDL